MENLNVINFVNGLYELVKADLYMLLVNESSNKCEYKGKLTHVGQRKNGGLVNLNYLVVNSTNMGYSDLVQACCFSLNNMLKTDIMLWGKAEVVEEFYGISPKFDSAVQFEVSLKFKEESK